MIDVGLKENLIINNPLDAALQELEILFNTENTQLLGVPTYGINFEQFLWALTPATDSIERYIKNKITTCTYYLARMSYEVTANFLESDGECSYIVNITVTYKDTTHSKNFVIQHE
jgi:hypothetical protein